MDYRIRVLLALLFAGIMAVLLALLPMTPFMQGGLALLGAVIAVGAIAALTPIFMDLQAEGELDWWNHVALKALHGFPLAVAVGMMLVSGIIAGGSMDLQGFSALYAYFVAVVGVIGGTFILVAGYFSGTGEPVEELDEAAH